MFSVIRNRLRKLDRTGLRPGSLSAYGFALACFAIAGMTSYLFSRIIDNITESIPFHSAIFIAALFGGIRAGALTAVCSALLLWWTDPDFLGQADIPLTQFINLGLYAASAVLSVWVAESLRLAISHRQESESLLNSDGSVIVPFPRIRPEKFHLGREIVRLRREGPYPNSIAAYALSFICVALATLVRFAVGWFSDEVLPFACYFPGILIVALVAGLEAGIAATVLSLMVVGWAFVPPYFSIGLPTPDQVVDCELFLFVSMLSILLIERYRYDTVRAGRDVPVRLETFTPIVVSFGLLLFTSLVLLIFAPILGAQYLVLGYLVPTTIIAVLYGNTLAVLTSFGGCIAAAYFLFPPTFSLYIDDRAHIVTLVIFILIALAIGKIASLLTYGGRSDGESAQRKDKSLFFVGNAERGRTGILLIHSAGGTPLELQTVASGLAARGFTVSCCQLTGHGGSEEELLTSRWTDWYNSAEQALQELEQRCQVIVIGGLSEGSNIALRLAALRPASVDGLCLFAPILRYNGWAMPWYRFLLMLGLRAPFLRRMRLTDPAPYGIKDEATRAMIANIANAAPRTEVSTQSTSLGMLQESHKLVRDVSWRLPSIKAPALIIHPREDDISDLSNTIYLQRRLGGLVECVVLDDSYHRITVDRQRDVVMNQTADFVSFVERLAAKRRAEVVRLRPPAVAGHETRPVPGGSNEIA